jgi:Hint domain
MARTISSNSGAVKPSGTAQNPLTINPGIIVNGGTGSYAVYADTSLAWTIVNFGTLTATNGVYLNGSTHADLTNSGTGALISGTQDGVDLLKNTDTVINTGTILGGSRYGVWLKNTKGMVTNSGTASLIQGGQDGMFGTMVGDTVFNQGTIRGVSADGVYLEAFGIVTNSASALIFGGGNYGVRITGGVGHVTNEGSIISANAAGVDFLAGGTLINDGTAALIQAPSWGAYFGIAGGVVTVTNQGTIAGTGGSGRGIHFGDGGVLTNSAGVITGSYGGVDIAGAPGYVVNQSRISGGVAGVFELAGGSLTNSSTGTISAAYAVVINGGTAALTNAGDIDGGVKGVEVNNGGTVVNAAGATISAPLAVHMFGGVSRLSNTGVINGGAGTAVSLGAGYNNLLAVYPGASFTGTVDGGNTIGATAISTLQLASAASAGALTGLGSQFVNFAAVTVDANADWTLTGANTIAGTLANAGTINGEVTLAAGAMLTNAATGSISHTTGAGTDLIAIAATGAASVVNAGHIYGYGHGVVLNGGGQLTNLASAVIADGAYAVVAVHGGGVVINDGTLTGGAASSLVGADLYDGSSLTNQSNGLIKSAIGVTGRNAKITVVNAGSIATYYNPDGIGVNLNAGGSVTNLTGGFISGRIYGIEAAGAATTIVNAGTIEDPTVAIKFAAGYASRLIVDPGALFSGTVVGGSSTLELASAASTGTLSGLGSQFTNFANVTVDSSAVWSVSGSIGSGVTFTNAGSVFLPQTLAGGALLSNASSGIISASGGKEAVLGLGGASTIVNDGVITSGALSGYYAIDLRNGGLVTNQAQGTISGPIGVLMSGTGTIVNSGRIGNSSVDGVKLMSGGTVVNLAGTISGYYAVQIYGAAGTIINAATLAGASTIAAVSFSPGFANRLIVDPGAVFTGTVTGGNTIDAIAVSTLELASSASAGTLSGVGTQFIDFAQTTIDAGAAWTLDLPSPTTMHGSIAGFGSGDTLDLTGVTFSSVTFNGGTLEFAGGSFPLALAGASGVHAISDDAGGALVTVTCFRAGTRIATPHGEVSVEALQVDDRVCLAHGGEARIKSLGHRRVDCAHHPRPQSVWPVRIAAGAFGERGPHRDLWLSPDHSVLLDDVLVPVKHLIDEQRIVQVPMASVEYWHVELARHDVLLAEGLPAESYLDTGDRASFDNGIVVRLLPEFRADDAVMRTWEARACAPLVVPRKPVSAVGRSRYGLLPPDIGMFM